MTTKDLVEDAVLYIPRNTIHPDPDQPRVKVDAELQASIDAEGIIQAITVRPHPELEDEWIIVDGERRWVGGAHLKTIPCRIRLDLEEPVDRLITQLSANTGKPLSPIEQARAFKKALDSDEKLSQAKLAERLGIPRTTIGDRIRLIEIHPAWMKLIESGKLQVSHAPLIHQYKAVPDEYQEKAAAHVRGVRADDVIRVADMRKELYRAFRDYVIRLDKVSSYKGPVLEIEEETWSSGGTRLKKVKYAADITLWRPIRNAAERRRRKEKPGLYGSSSTSSAPSRKAPIDLATDLLGDRVKVKTSTAWHVKPGPGEIEVFSESGWASGLDPEVLSAQLGADDLIVRQGQGGGRKRIFTTNSRAVELAQNSFEEKLLAEMAPNLKKLTAKLTGEAIESQEVSGPGVRVIVASLLPLDEYESDAAGVLQSVSLALVGRALPDPRDFDYNSRFQETLAALKGFTDAELGAVLSGVCAALSLKLKPTSLTEQRESITEQTAGAPFSFRDAEPPKSKKQQKREARAAGKQVGDPSRKNGPSPSLEELESAEIDDHDLEEELVEA